MRVKLLCLLSILFFFVSCQTVPITGRRQLSLIPGEQISTMSFNSYKDFLSKHEVIRGTEQARMITRVGTRIQKAVEKYFADQGQADSLKEYKWEFNLIKDPVANAWCMPGGKVVVYTGILPITQNDAGLAKWEEWHLK